jgi:hypothetical protein
MAGSELLHQFLSRGRKAQGTQWNQVFPLDLGRFFSLRRFCLYPGGFSRAFVTDKIWAAAGGLRQESGLALPVWGILTAEVL